MSETILSRIKFTIRRSDDIERDLDFLGRNLRGSVYDCRRLVEIPSALNFGEDNFFLIFYREINRGLSFTFLSLDNSYDRDIRFKAEVFNENSDRPIKRFNGVIKAGQESQAFDLDIDC